MSSPSVRPHQAVTFGWAAVILTVVTYDAWAISTGHETLSAGFWRLKQSRLGKVIIGLGWLMFSWHMLAGDRLVLPQRYHAIYVRWHPFHRGLGRLPRVEITEVVLEPGD